MSGTSVTGSSRGDGPCGPCHLPSAGSYQLTTGERAEPARSVSVVAPLIDRILDILSGELLLELDVNHRDAVDVEDHVHRLVIIGDVLIHAESVKVVLVADKREAASEGHDELLDVLDYALLQHTLVDIFGIANAQLLRVDEIDEVLVLESGYGPQCLLTFRQGRQEVVGRAPWWR